jgi:hypothetical protein
METVYTLLCANGAVAPLYIETSRSVTGVGSLIDPRFGYVHKKVKGEVRPGENGMLRALNYYRSKGWIKPITTVALCTGIAKSLAFVSLKSFVLSGPGSRERDENSRDCGLG